MTATSLIEPGIATVPEGRLAERQWARTLDSSGWVTAPILDDRDASLSPSGTMGIPRILREGDFSTVRSVCDCNDPDDHNEQSEHAGSAT